MNKLLSFLIIVLLIWFSKPKETESTEGLIFFADFVEISELFLYHSFRILSIIQDSFTLLRKLSLIYLIITNLIDINAKYFDNWNHWPRWYFLVDRLMKSYSDINILGVSRNKEQENFFKKLLTLNKYNLKNLNLKNINLLDLKEVEKNILEFKPDKIFNLSGPSSVYESLLYPERTMNEICKIFENITQTLINSELLVPFFQASSSDMFGQIKNV